MKTKLQSLAVLTLFIFISSTTFAQTKVRPKLNFISTNGTEFLIVVPGSEEKNRPELVIGEDFKPLKGAFNPDDESYDSWKFTSQEVGMGEKSLTFYSLSCNNKYLYRISDNTLIMDKYDNYKKIYEKDANGNRKINYDGFMRYMFKLVPTQDGKVQFYYMDTKSDKVKLLYIKGSYQGTPIKLILWKK